MRYSGAVLKSVFWISTKIRSEIVLLKAMVNQII